MVRAFFVFLCANLVFSSCTQRLICPAYQSAFIYDQEALRKKFSYFQEDSTPKVYTASKNKYLIAEEVSYKRKIRSMQTVAMKPVNVVVPDSLQPGYEESLMDSTGGVVPGAELDLAARSVIDSTYIIDVPQDTASAAEDSVYVITKDREVRILKYDFPDSLIYDPATGKYAAETPKYTVTEVRFNVEQDNYMWYLRDYLVLPDVRLAHNNPGGGADGKAAKGKKEKKGFFGFFKNLFKKKKEAPVDSAAQKAPVRAEDDFDYVDEDEQLKAQQRQEQQTAPKEKKGPFSFLKKKKDQAPAEKPAKKKKEKKEKKPKEEEEIPPAVEGDEKKTEDEGF